MSLLPRISVDPPSRAQSANDQATEETTITSTNTTAEKTSRPPSAPEKNADDTSKQITNDAGMTSDARATESEEPVLSTVTLFGRPSSVNKQSATDTSAKV